MEHLIKTNITHIPVIHTEWKILRVKDIFYLSKEKAGITNPTILSLARSGVKIRDISTNEGQLAADYTNYNPVQKGDFLLNTMDLYSGANCNVSDVEGVISPAYANLRLKSKECNPKYFDYFFKTQYWTMSLFANGKGVSFDNRWTLNNEALFNYFIPVPDFEMQNKIVKKINEFEHRIDKLLDSNDSKIEKLKEIKNSLVIDLISGKNILNIEKNKNIQWLGNIPSNWRIEKIGSLFGLRNDKVSDKDFKPLSVSKGGIVPQIETVAKSDASDDRKLVRKNDFVINSRSDRKQSCGLSSFDGSVSLINIVIYKKTNLLLPKFVNYLLKNKLFAEEFYKNGHGIVDDLWTTRWQEMKNILIPVPPVEIQKVIIEKLEVLEKKIEDVISNIEKKSAILKQYKQSLIFEYVYGIKEA